MLSNNKMSRVRRPTLIHDEEWYLEKRTRCQSCNFNEGNITKCIYCDMAVCASCLSDCQFCIRCLHNNNSIEACNDWLSQKNKIRWFKIDTNTGDIIPIKKKWWMMCFY